MNLRRIAPDLALLYAGLIWGSTFILVKQALAYTDPFLFLTLRFTLALGIITLLVARRGFSLTKLEWRGGIITGLTLFFGFSLQTWGLVYTTASRSAFITGLNVVLVPFLLWALEKKQIAAKRWIAALLATAGLYLLTNQGKNYGVNIGDVLTLFCAVAFAAQIMFLGRYAPVTDTLRYFWVQLLTVVVMSAAAAALTGNLELTPDPALWWGLSITGILATAVAFLGMTWAQRYTPPTRAALLLTSEPVFGALFAVVLAGELLTATGWLGGLIIVGAIVWSEMGAATLPWGPGDPAGR